MKHINLYRNIFSAEERRRKILFYMLFVVLLVSLVIGGVVQMIGADTESLEEELLGLNHRIQAESDISSTFAVEAKKQKESISVQDKSELNKALEQLGNQRGDLTQFALLLERWKGIGASLSHVIMSKDQLEILGRASTREAAVFAISEMRELLSNSDWVVQRDEVKLTPNVVVEFTVKAQRQKK